MTRNSPLFEPITLGKMALRNRIVMAPMTRSFSPNNIPNDDNVAYYKRRAAGDVGLIITEGTCIDHPAASGYPDVPFFYGEEALDGWRRVVEGVHAAGGAIAPQLWHVGSVRRGNFPPTKPAEAVSPSGLYRDGKPNGVALSEAEIGEIVDAFATAARSAEEIGFDAVELHGAHGYLIDQFFWDETNKRDDRYGGDLVARTTFAVEIIEAVRAQVSRDFPVILRFSQWKSPDYGTKLAYDPAELQQFLTPLVDAGVDIFHCSTRRYWEPEFDGSDLNLAGWTKKLTGKPTITVGSVGVTTPFIGGEAADQSNSQGSGAAVIDDLDRRIEAGEFAMVAVGRALLQTPDWVQKMRDGRFDEISDYSDEARQKYY